MYITDSRNWRRLIILILLQLMIYSDGYGQNTYDPIVPSEGRTIQDFIPEGWKLLDSATGDLNKDGSKDIAMIIQSIENVNSSEIDEDHQYPSRNLLILWGDPEGGLKQAARNTSFIAEQDDPNMDDPFRDISIQRGTLKISFSQFFTMGSWHTYGYDYVFRYQRNQFELIGFTYSSFHRASMDFEEYSYNFSTKKRSHTVESENKKKVAWKSINITALKTLDELTQPYEWDKENGIAQ